MLNLMPKQKWELKHLRSHLCQKSQSCTSEVFDKFNLIYIYPDVEREQIIYMSEGLLF